MKQNRKWILILSIVLSVAIAAGGTMAYLQDTDEDVNVMTLGNVYINQLEYERVPAEGHKLTNDAWVSTGETDKYGYTPDEVRPFTQAKPLFPAVFTDGIVKWDERTGSNGDPHQQSWADVKGEKTKGAPGSFQLFDDSVKNAVDKFVFVENTGNSDAYVRTWFAFEQGDVAAEDFDKVIATNENDAEGESGSGHWVWEKVASDVKIDGNTYVVKVATYLGPKSAPTQVLPAGEISYVSLAQVYMKPEATNDDVIAIDGNKNGTYDILVLSQAVQTQGFASAEAALNEAFGEPTVENIPWDEVEFLDLIYNYVQLADASFKGGDYIIGDDIEMDNFMYVFDNKEVSFDLNGYELTNMIDEYTIVSLSGAKLTLKGAGTVNLTKGFFVSSDGEVVIDDGTYNFMNTSGEYKGIKYCSYMQGKDSKITINDGVFKTNHDNAALFYFNTNSVLEINGGFFENTADTTPLLFIGGMSGSDTNLLILKGGTFVNFNPLTDLYNNRVGVTQRPADESQISLIKGGFQCVIWPGYDVVSETQDNGDIWYTVVKK